jgi:uncharacterized SAM-binding protein YcdF (DUF218 family)
MPASPAQIVYDYLNVCSTPPPAAVDAIIGFGHFDLRIATHCAELWLAGVAPIIIFTGGVGAGSADLDRPEAEAFAAKLQQDFPAIPTSAILLETRSTNTGENVRELIKRAQQNACPLHQVLLVATPFRQRRVAQTWSAQGPGDSIGSSAPVPSTLTEDIELFNPKIEDLVAQLPGEIDRLQNYGKRGWIASESIPLAVIRASAAISRQKESRTSAKESPVPQMQDEAIVNESE